MKTLPKATCLILLAFNIFAIQSVSANPIDHRQDAQRARIAEGMKSGELTAREAKRLGKNQRRIAAKEHKYREDGVLTARERKKLHKSLNKSSKRIYKQKHDRQSR